MDISEDRPRTSLFVFESVLRVVIWVFLGLQIIVVLFFGTMEIESFDWSGRLNSIKSVPNPAVIWMVVLMVSTYFSWLYVAKKTGKLRYWWLGLIAICIGGALIFLTKDRQSIVTYRAPRKGFQESPYLPSSPYRGF